MKLCPSGRLSSTLKTMKNQGNCSYHFTEEELKSHAVDAEGWNEVRDFFDRIEDLVKRDGWTHPETFDVAFDFFCDLPKLGLRRMKGREREIFDKHTS
ncbi:hypothetical protein N7539_008705 [Penicillium diatomitis]|uniref:Uncharacterized protein n=1 Tax=Penicillium diatomitis TaxID=2819901 RepID=A0A9W9WRF1_9EURO|nr:uncharacterized protein N7539_008705 [Penicillium diatomitis]KAJ5472136.1 hypothetical protein N7539_008705 [Penicillium diatomitis]